MKVQAPVDAFVTVEFSAASRGAPPLTPSANGAFLNYQLSAQHITDTTLGGAFTELGIFNRAGVLTSSSVLRYQSDINMQPSSTKWIRLDTAFTHDFPSRIERLVIGDSITDGGSWGQCSAFRWHQLGQRFFTASGFDHHTTADCIGYCSGAIHCRCIRQQSESHIAANTAPVLSSLIACLPSPAAGRSAWW